MAKKFSNAARAGEQGDERRLQIITAAAEAFMTDGFAATSIDDIARLLGCTKGLIYYHFKNKTELFFAVHSQTMETNLVGLRPIAGSNLRPAERMTRMIRAHLDGIFERLPFQRVAVLGLEMHLVGSTTPHERRMLNAIVKMHDEYEELFIRAIADGIVAGEFEAGDARLWAKPLLGAMNWMVMWYRPRPNGGSASREKLVVGMTSFLLRGLGAKSPG